MTLNELVKLTMLWTTGPWTIGPWYFSYFFIKRFQIKELLPVVSSRHLPFRTHGHMYSSCVQSSMLHASEIWPWTKPNLQCLQRNHRAMIRQICNVRPHNIVTIRSNELLAQLGMEGLDQILKERRLWCYEHMEHSNGAVISLWHTTKITTEFCPWSLSAFHFHSISCEQVDGIWSNVVFALAITRSRLGLLHIHFCIFTTELWPFVVKKKRGKKIVHAQYHLNKPTVMAQVDVCTTGDLEVASLTFVGWATFFCEDWSWNIFCSHSLPSPDSRRAVVSFWQKNVHNTG